MHSVSVNFPKVVAVDDYHDFHNLLDSLREFVDWGDDILSAYKNIKGPQKLPLIDFVEFPAENAVSAYNKYYVAVFYSPFLKGHKLKSGSQEMYEIILNDLNDKKQKTLQKSSSKKSKKDLLDGPAFLSQRDFLDFLLEDGGDSHDQKMTDVFNIWKSGLEKKSLEKELSPVIAQKTQKLSKKM